MLADTGAMVNGKDHEPPPDTRLLSEVGETGTMIVFIPDQAK